MQEHFGDLCKFKPLVIDKAKIVTLLNPKPKREQPAHALPISQVRGGSESLLCRLGAAQEGLPLNETGEVGKELLTRPRPPSPSPVPSVSPVLAWTGWGGVGERHSTRQVAENPPGAPTARPNTR